MPQLSCNLYLLTLLRAGQDRRALTRTGFALSNACFLVAALLLGRCQRLPLGLH